jgi:transcription-repair coupling factor (superfamily II helicase)
VPEAARPLFVAAIAALSQRHPILVATPTATDAGHIANDLRAFLGDDAVDTFPAWETLPFERVSPNVETMGRRLRTMWHLREPERAPRAVVAPFASFSSVGRGRLVLRPLGAETETLQLAQIEFVEIRGRILLFLGSVVFHGVLKKVGVSPRWLAW